MTRHSNRRSFAFASSTLGATLISVLAAWTISSVILDPVVLNSAGAVHLKSDQPFDVASHHGDWTWREIPTDIATSELMITHTHYSHVDADRDINCMFPLDRLRELCDQDIIGGIASSAYSIMGFQPDPEHLVTTTAPALARLYKDSGADVVFMTCG